MKSTLASLLCYPAHRLRLVESWWVGCAMSSAARISFMPVTEKNLEVFKVINENVLPVTYAEKFYLDLLKQPADMTKFGKFSCL